MVTLTRTLIMAEDTRLSANIALTSFNA